MEEFVIVLNQVTVLFLILIIGYVGGKAKIIDSTATKKLSEILLFITSPMMVLNSFFIEFSKERVTNMLWILGLGTGMFIISIIVAKFMFKGFNEKVAPILNFTAVFSNCGYMGFPLLKALFGDEGVFYGSFYIVLFNVFLWSYGFIIFGGKGTRKQIIKKVLLTPAIIALYIGLIIFLFGIPVHNTIKGAVGSVVDMTMPISMLIIGGVISTVKITTVFCDWKVYLSSGVRLIVMPIIALLLARISGSPALPGAVLVTALAMPAATATTMFSEMFDRDTVFSSKCVTVSTLLSIITIPVVVSIVVKGML